MRACTAKNRHLERDCIRNPMDETENDSQNGEASHLSQLSHDLLGRVLRFVDGDSVLAVRATSKEFCISLENSPVWSCLMAGINSYRCPTKSRFREYTYYRKLVTRWHPGRRKGPSSFSIDVYARVKGGWDHPSHMIMNPDEVVLMSHYGPRSFGLSQVFTPTATQTTVFHTVMDELIVDALCGLSSTVFFYGQTGSGKTHTSLGPSEDALDGVIPLTISALLASPDTQVRLKVLEIYCESLEILQHEIRLHDMEEARSVLKAVMKQRVTKATSWNPRSSRSHAIFSIRVTCRMAAATLESTLNLVDLAGAERQRDDAPLLTMAGDSLKTDVDLRAHQRALVKEASKINVSLTTLGRVILALSENPKPQHIPFRDSKLTLLLRASLGGETLEGTISGGRSAFVLTLSPNESDVGETLSTLQFGERAQQVRTCSHSKRPVKDSSYLDLIVEEWKLRVRVEELRAVWQSCGSGRHDPTCRCDRCIDRLERPVEPLHIPKYVAMKEELAQLHERLEEARLASIGDVLS